jgi:hypothetical protein
MVEGKAIPPREGPSNEPNNMTKEWREIWPGQGPSNNRPSYDVPDTKDSYPSTVPDKLRKTTND